MRSLIRPRLRENLVARTPVRSSRSRVEAVAPLIMRVALGIVFIWFGALKIANVTPVATLVADTLAWVPVDPDILLPALGAFEIVLGAMVIVGWHLRLVLTVLIAHLCGTFLVLVVLPQAAFERGNPLLLTTIGEFVVKNVVFIAAALLLAAWPRTAPAPERRHDGDVSTI